MIFKMPYFNSSTSVFLLKLLILSGTLKKVSIVSNSQILIAVPSVK